MILSMTQDQSATLGGFYVFGFIALFVGVTWWLNRRFGERIRYNQRRRQVERAMNEYEVNSSMVDDILRERRSR